MTSTHVEIERKLELPDAAELPDLTGVLEVLPRGSTVREASRERLEAVYFDTADLRLFHAGWTLRRRTGGRDGGWHLKLPQGPEARLEVRLPLGRSLRTVPVALRRFAWIHARGVALRPVAEISTSRRVHQLCAADGAILAEVAEDHVRARRLAPSAAGDSPIGRTTWREIEVELVDGEPDLLTAVVEWLRARGATRSVSASKLARALRMGSAGAGVERTSPRLTSKRTAAYVVGAYLRQQVSEIRRLDPQVRLATPESVHQMRVATRRVRSALEIFHVLFVPEATEPVQMELKWLAGALGRVRDAEVQQTALHDALEVERGERVLTRGVGGVLEREVDDEHRAAVRALAPAMDSERYRNLICALDDLMDRPPLSKRASRSAAKVLPRQVARAYDELARTMAEAFRLPPGRERDEALHSARKSAKRTRYAAEAISPAFGKPGRRFAAALRDVGEELGQYHDGVVMLRRLHQGAMAEDSAAVAFTYGRLYAREEARQNAISSRTKAIWKSASRTSLRAWLA